MQSECINTVTLPLGSVLRSHHSLLFSSGHGDNRGSGRRLRVPFAFPKNPPMLLPTNSQFYPEMKLHHFCQKSHMETWFSFASGHTVFDKIRRKSLYQHFRTSSKGEKKEGSKTPPALRASTEQARDHFSQVPNPEVVNAAPWLPLTAPNQLAANAELGADSLQHAYASTGRRSWGERKSP